MGGDLAIVEVEEVVDRRKTREARRRGKLVENGSKGLIRDSEEIIDGSLLNRPDYLGGHVDIAVEDEVLGERLVGLMDDIVLAVQQGKLPKRGQGSLYIGRQRKGVDLGPGFILGDLGGHEGLLGRDLGSGIDARVQLLAVHGGVDEQEVICGFPVLLITLVEENRVIVVTKHVEKRRNRNSRKRRKGKLKKGDEIRRPASRNEVDKWERVKKKPDQRYQKRREAVGRRREGLGRGKCFLCIRCRRQRSLTSYCRLLYNENSKNHQG